MRTDDRRGSTLRVHRPARARRCTSWARLSVGGDVPERCPGDGTAGRDSTGIDRAAGAREGDARNAAPPEILRVAVIDDAPSVRTIVRMLVARTAGYELVVEAEDIATAQAPLRRAAPHVVLLDLLLPGVDGVTGFSQVAAAAPQAMVVILSALSSTDEAARAFDAGAFAYLEKSVLGPTLLEQLRELHRLHLAARTGVDVWNAPEAPERVRR